MLKSHELKELQKSFKINSKSNKNMTKPEMIKSFINFVKNQTTISGKTMNDNLKNWFVVFVYYIFYFIC